MNSLLFPGRLILTISVFLVLSLRLHSQTEWETVKNLQKEPDWVQLRDLNVEIFDKLVTASNSTVSVDFNNEFEFLSFLGLNKEQYYRKVEMMKSAARRLTTKYGFSELCEPCNSPFIVDKLKEIVIDFRQNNLKYKQYRSILLGGELDDEPSRCCGLRFYLCCTVCAATIAAFPAYLACCALCFDTYCCKP